MVSQADRVPPIEDLEFRSIPIGDVWQITGIVDGKEYSTWWNPETSGLHEAKENVYHQYLYDWEQGAFNKRKTTYKLNKNHFRIKKKDNGQYKVTCSFDLYDGDVLQVRGYTEVKDRNVYTVEFGEDYHVMHNVMRYINHSCDPNMYFDKDKRSFIVTETINEGQEITFDYKENESEISSPFDCGCGYEGCRGRIE